MWEPRPRCNILPALHWLGHQALWLITLELHSQPVRTAFNTLPRVSMIADRADTQLCAICGCALAAHATQHIRVSHTIKIDCLRRPLGLFNSYLISTISAPYLRLTADMTLTAFACFSSSLVRDRPSESLCAYALLRWPNTARTVLWDALAVCSVGGSLQASVPAVGVGEQKCLVCISCRPARLPKPASGSRQPGVLCAATLRMNRSPSLRAIAARWVAA